MTGRRPLRLALAFALAAAGLAGCAGAQSALAPAGPQAARVGRLFWLYLGVCAAVFVLQGALIAAALVRRARRRRTPPLLSPPRPAEGRLTRAVWGAVVLTAVALFALLAADFSTGRALHALGASTDLTVKVTGHQWWWEVEYQDPTPGNIVTTANEVHVPVGRTVRLDLRSADVIHSVWVPNLLGKKDLIPGHPTQTFFRADRPGTFRGQCAEFCGLQHAFMRLVVVAEPEAAFESWLGARRRSAPDPTSDRLERGRRVFLGSTCVMCHAVQGTEARAKVGPDLTHLAGRPLIGGVLANNRGNLAGWVVDPQRVKPGVRMPMNPVKPDDLDFLLDYLQSLK